MFVLPSEKTAWLDDLNEAQCRAVLHTDGPLLVIAGAGSGKTRTLASRVARLIDDGADPDRILLLTFTRRAAAEMLRRAAGLIADRSAGRVWGGTFHGTANRFTGMANKHRRVLRSWLKQAAHPHSDSAVFTDGVWIHRPG